MSGQSTAFGRFVKWLLIPAIIAAIGYFMVGPSLGKDPNKKIKIPVIDTIIQPKQEPETKPATPQPRPEDDGPQVDITVRPTHPDERSGSR